MQRVFLILAVLVSGCAARGTFTPLPAGAVPAASEAIFVATTRLAGPKGFGFDRSDQASFLRYDITIPADRASGELNWPPKSRAPDARRDFLMLDEMLFASGADFRQALTLAMRLRKQTTAVVYVHGFNNTMAEGVYRVAQMHHDLAVPGVAVHYAWPSRGSALGYLHDRESVLFARSGFEKLLQEVKLAGAKEIVIVAHSMGAPLTMETLRQMVLRDGPRALDPLAGVILLSPDLDVDVFRSQARDIGKLPQPFVVFGSARDKVLGVSARLAGSDERLGNLKTLAKIADLDVLYLETTAFDVGAGHQNLGDNPALLQLIGGISGIDRAFQLDDRSRVGLLPGLVLTVRRATEIVLSAVGAISDGQ